MPETALEDDKHARHNSRAAHLWAVFAFGSLFGLSARDAAGSGRLDVSRGGHPVTVDPHFAPLASYLARHNLEYECGALLPSGQSLCLDGHDGDKSRIDDPSTHPET